MKVVYNACFGGFSLSYAGVQRYAELKGIKIYGYVNARKNGHLDFDNYEPYQEGGRAPFCIHYRTKPLGEDGKIGDEHYWSDRDLERNDPVLVQVVEELGDKANGTCAKLAIVEVPDDVKWEIDEYDGNESVDECHRSWR